MTQKPFGTKATTKKLQTIADYLEFYSTALGGKFRLTYVDAFAGTGEIPHGDELPLFEGQSELSDVIEGSARRALRIARPFDRYKFIDSNRANIFALNQLPKEFPLLADRIEVIRSDANVAVREFCAEQMTNRDRAVIFLDPFGNQVHWETIETISKTKGIDLWYLFPSGIGVRRQISQSGQVQKDAEKSLDRLFGTTEWRNEFISTELQNDFFEADRSSSKRIIADADAVTRYMIKRMKSVFDDKVLDSWLPLGKRGGHWYSLLFAWSNPSKNASTLARRVASEIMRRK